MSKVEMKMIKSQGSGIFFATFDVGFIILLTRHWLPAQLAN
jgi:hypothetical protein